MDRGSRHLTILGSLLSLRVCALAAETTPAELPRRLLLVRHGETDFNRAGRIQGTLESQLTDTGRSQAKVLGEYLAEFHAGSIDRVLCSPKARTRATLDEIEAAIDAAGMPRLPEREVRVDLRELELTSWEGRYRSDIQRDDAAAWQSWKTAPADFVFADTGHAPLRHVWGRIESEWAHLLASSAPGTTTLVVAHGAFNRAFLAQIFGLPMTTFVDSDTQRFGFVNCECAEIEWSGADGTAQLRWRRRHPRTTEWSTQEDEQAVGSADATACDAV